MIFEEQVKEELEWVKGCIMDEGEKEWNMGYKKALETVLESQKRNSEELRTLKELRHDAIESGMKDIYSNEDILWFEQRLRDEATKWIKKLQAIQKDLIGKKIGIDAYNSYSAQVRWIKHFFNIKEEDLEEKK